MRSNIPVLALPHKYFLDSINLLATEVKSRVERLLAGK